ncbi:hypothetical protein OESDEN_09132 [Oesophagostomum dentatum]|uniref:Uncharacterized protein n=1 Tax=Oesophagostomum dentatum TaxID=61180 RepID=A0A0B1T5F0_OESDE|nr:hypothetical protein OESDEN_09132 [Oesophagostomum dentatum]
MLHVCAAIADKASSLRANLNQKCISGQIGSRNIGSDELLLVPGIFAFGVLFVAIPCFSKAAFDSEDPHLSCELQSEENGKNQKAVVISYPLCCRSCRKTFVQGALKEMKDVEVDLRVYEDLIVKLEKGDEHKLSHLGRVSLKSPSMVMINFADNPSAIKWAKLAIQV